MIFRRRSGGTLLEKELWGLFYMRLGGMCSVFAFSFFLVVVMVMEVLFPGSILLPTWALVLLPVGCSLMTLLVAYVIQWEIRRDEARETHDSGSADVREQAYDDIRRVLDAGDHPPDCDCSPCRIIGEVLLPFQDICEPCAQAVKVRRAANRIITKQ